LWGKKSQAIHFDQVQPLVCGADHHSKWGVTGYQDPKHWCSLVRSDHPGTGPSGNVPAAAQTRTTEWSPWTRAEDAQYRYQLRWDPQKSSQVEAIFQIKNMLNARWEGSARSADCTRGTLSADTHVLLQPNETREFTFRTPNCGTKDQPSINHPGLARSKTL
jgi:hypothetical protein